MNTEVEMEQEILSPTQAVDSGTLALLNKSEIDQAITTAKKFPRKLTAFLNTATQLATQDPETADECIYALPRDGRTIEGPSARFAEIIAYAWGNCRAGARVIGEDEEFVTAQGSFYDLEQNVHIGYEVKRRITTRAGKRYNSDMISTTANAACSIALRNAVLKGVPKAMWRKIYDRARQTIAGDVKTLVERRAAALKALQIMGAQPDRIFAVLDVKGIEDITLDHLVTLRGIYNAIKEGDTTVERAFAPKVTESEDGRLAGKSARNLDEIKARYSHDQAEAAARLANVPAVADADPALAEKLRAEAARQKAAVAEKFGNGASQPATPQPSGAATPVDAEPSAPPQPSQEAEATEEPPAPEPGAADIPASGSEEVSAIPILDFKTPSQGKTRKR